MLFVFWSEWSDLIFWIQIRGLSILELVTITEKWHLKIGMDVGGGGAGL